MTEGNVSVHLVPHVCWHSCARANVGEKNSLYPTSAEANRSMFARREKIGRKNWEVKVENEEAEGRVIYTLRLPERTDRAGRVPCMRSITQHNAEIQVT